MPVADAEAHDEGHCPRAGVPSTGNLPAISQTTDTERLLSSIRPPYSDARCGVDARADAGAPNTMKGEAMKGTLSKILAGTAATLTLAVGGLAVVGIHDSSTEQARIYPCPLDQTTPHCP